MSWILPQALLTERKCRHHRQLHGGASEVLRFGFRLVVESEKMADLLCHYLWPQRSLLRPITSFSNCWSGQGHISDPCHVARRERSASRIALHWSYSLTATEGQPELSSSCIKAFTLDWQGASDSAIPSLLSQSSAESFRLVASSTRDWTAG